MFKKKDGTPAPIVLTPIINADGICNFCKKPLSGGVHYCDDSRRFADLRFMREHNPAERYEYAKLIEKMEGVCVERP